MDLKAIPSEDLITELKLRGAGASPDADTTLVVGTICDYPEGPAVEIFRKVESPTDLPSDNELLRARFNSHRKYRMFYFKTYTFDALKDVLDRDWHSFSKWVTECESIKMTPI